MKRTPDFEFPEPERQFYDKARKLEWLSVAYLCSAACLLYFTMGVSQAMRASFWEDVINIVPSMAFLICARIALKPPSQDYPYGLHGAVGIGYLVSSLALIAMGLLLLVESIGKFISGERTTIGGAQFFGHTIWAGWPMLAALAYTGIPTVFLGRLKHKIAPKIHDKILYADAKMMKADWMSGGATAIGVLGTGFGYWWLDPAAAILVSLDILKDGATNLSVAISDLIERRPMKTDRSGPETLPADLKRWFEGLDWVKEAQVRLRETGHVFYGEAYVTPRTGEGLPGKIRQAVDGARRLDWRLHDVTVMVVDHLDDE